MARLGLINTNKKKKNTVQYRHRCTICGRPRGYIGFFKICRICFRTLAGNGQLPGIKKASW